MRSPLRRTILALPLLALAVSAGAQTLPQRIASAGVIRVGVNSTYPPLESRDPATNQLVGFDIDLGEEMARRLGVRLEWVDGAFAQLMPGLQTGRTDMVLSGISDLPARRETFDFVDYLKSGAQFITLASNTTIRTATDLCGKRVGTVRSTSFPANIEAWSNENCVAAGRPAIQYVGGDRMPLVHLELQQGRVDASVQGSETIPTLIASNPNTYRIVTEPFTTVRQGIMFRKEDAQLRDAFAATLRAMMQDGTYMRLIEKWQLQASAATEVLINGEAPR